MVGFWPEGLHHFPFPPNAPYPPPPSLPPSLSPLPPIISYLCSQRSRHLSQVAGDEAGVRIQHALQHRRDPDHGGGRGGRGVGGTPGGGDTAAPRAKDGDAGARHACEGGTG